MARRWWWNHCVDLTVASNLLDCFSMMAVEQARLYKSGVGTSTCCTGRVTIITVGSSGSSLVLNPRLWHIASMVLFSRSTWPSTTSRPSHFAYSIMIAISRQPMPWPFRSERIRMPYSPRW